ncbi:conserved hypothetical protein [Neorickettsia risticii str. Illinois]|uniref:Uncharacterized protein n=1 Tax=Neorickettsia risticii (strain Illinois) TaxID=434131 RepID=C6V5Z9_NEORI|nr:conserved hypothetical protein [Neorickettsia risticii str. Illinois]
MDAKSHILGEWFKVCPKSAFNYLNVHFYHNSVFGLLCAGSEEVVNLNFNNYYTGGVITWYEDQVKISYKFI